MLRERLLSRVGVSYRRGGVEEGEDEMEENEGVRSFWIQVRIDVEEGDLEVTLETRDLSRLFSV